MIGLLSKHSSFEILQFKKKTFTSISGFEIYSERRRVYCNNKEIHLTTKEFDILCMLVENRGQVMTYEQIYQRVWGGDPSGKVKSNVGYHIRNLRKKLCNSSSCAIQNVREVGYCFEVETDLI